MDGVVYSIKNKNNFPRIIAEVHASNQILAEYEVNLIDDISKLETLLIEEYSNKLELFFDETINNIKNNGLNIFAFTDKIALLTEILNIKTQCDNYVKETVVAE